MKMVISSDENGKKIPQIISNICFNFWPGKAKQIFGLNKLKMANF